ncbi:M20 family peptidase [Enterococcus sp. PF-2]|jgi:succinyl-diaminopimelate desuccinylase|uniref:Sapep family Mn(2+)-dependent dipeptidase n=1 Tax=Enterococcus entomosocium TaxID=3034352 RepID=A0ABV3M845_9ENTE|nr:MULTISPECIES: Sapep family Mn(2+)-dependent dipeptidase [Enterococcus]EPH97508.1 putative dipeptidase [Enterococcus faecalis 06-MB-DW-09]AUJ84378.1 peptidase M20 [Enterococcus sp. CR-Ec1]MBF0013175.1 M20 family metallopeptidase [Enterococcus casseliflavus]MDB1710024.1 Sapep family Mn(2+)-dependent dipeptidase [Enterococcus casseliflavus]MDB1715279.1 Sapep family Mn(2+)-dependent dipeptidase [Enterococcus casseliflavus]
MDPLTASIEANWSEFLTLLSEVMQIASVKGEPAPHAPYGKGPREVLAYVMEKSAAYGFQTTVIDDAIGYAHWGPTDTDYIGVLGHLDVVPAGSGWSYPPFALTEKDGNFYGRGILDNKGPIISCLFAMKLLKDLGHQPQLPLRIIFGTDEESGMSDIPHYLAAEQPPRFGFTPDCKYPVVYGERGVVNVQLDFPLPAQEQQLLAAFSGDQFRDHVPDHLSVTIGSQSFEALGKRSPSNAPELGDNAITKLAQQAAPQLAATPSLQAALQWIAQSFHQQHYGEGVDLVLEDADSGKLILTPVVLQKSASGLALEVAFRYPVSVTEEQVLAGVQKALPEGASLTILRSIPGFCRSKDAPEIQTLSTIYHQVTGNDPTPVTTTGATYARKMPNILAFGPSFPGQKGIAHNQDEYMAVADLRMNLEIYLRSLQALTK